MSYKAIMWPSIGYFGINMIQRIRGEQNYDFRKISKVLSLRMLGLFSGMMFLEINPLHEDLQRLRSMSSGCIRGFLQGFTLCFAHGSRCL